MHHCAFCFESRKPFTVKDFFEFGISDFGVGNCCLAAQAFIHRLVFGVVGVHGAFFQIGVNRRIHPRNKETCYGADVVNGFAFGSAAFESFDISVGHLHVIFDSENHRDVNVDAVIDSFFNGGQPFL